MLRYSIKDDVMENYVLVQYQRLYDNHDIHLNYFVTYYR